MVGETKTGVSQTNLPLVGCAFPSQLPTIAFLTPFFISAENGIMMNVNYAGLVICDIIKFLPEAT